MPLVLKLLWEAWADQSLGLPRYAKAGAAGADLCANLRPEHRAAGITLVPMARMVIATGLRVEIPPGYEVQIRPRSGLALRRMARTVEAMLKDALDSYVHRDAALAADVRARDLEVDQLYNALFREFLTYMMEDPRNISACMHLHFIAKNLERMGDHATSIAEQVLYLVSGELPEDPRPKSDSVTRPAGIPSA